MRKLIVSEFMSLDGVMEAPGGEEGHPHTGWVLDFLDPGQEAYKLDEVLASEALLLGRVTYEGFAEARPSRGGDCSWSFRSFSGPAGVSSRTRRARPC